MKLKIGIILLVLGVLVGSKGAEIENIGKVPGPEQGIR